MLLILNLRALFLAGTAQSLIQHNLLSICLNPTDSNGPQAHAECKRHKKIL